MLRLPARGQIGIFNRSYYEEALYTTCTDLAPWYMIPADKKWTARAVVADLLTTKIRSLDLHYPELTSRQREHLETVRRQLAGNGE